MLADQARLIAYTLSIAAEPALAAGQHHQLATVGHDLLNTRNVLYVAFLDANGGRRSSWPTGTSTSAGRTCPRPT